MRKKETKKAIQKQFDFLKFLTTMCVVDGEFEDGEGSFQRILPMKSIIPTKEPTFLCDETVERKLARIKIYKGSMNLLDFYLSLANYLSNLLYFFWHSLNYFPVMADGIRRAMQDIDLGFNDPPFVLPTEVVRQAEEENRFLLIGRPVMPRRQNLRAIVASMPRNWGFEGIVRGRIIEGRQFQFVFPSEEAMETVLRRGPWAFAERMLVLQRWSPLMDMDLLNFIPFWIQVRGIPFQYMNREVIVNIAREMGQYIQMDYNEEVGGRQEFVRIRLNWNVANPVRFQRHFQFSPGVNTLLRFKFERLRGFCEECGMLTHDTGACVINNGGPAHDGGDDHDEGDQEDEPQDQNHGVFIEEIQEPIPGDEDAAVVPAQEEYERNIDVMEHEAEADELWSEAGKQTMYSDDLTCDEMYNPIDPFGIRKENESGAKRKGWLNEAEKNVASFGLVETGEASTSHGCKRQRGSLTQISGEVCKEVSVTTDDQGGAVGPEPPLPP